MLLEVMEPRILEWRFKNVLKKYLKDNSEHLCTRDGKPDTEAIKRLVL